MSQDFYLNAAQQRAAELEMEISAAKTDLLTYRHNQDLPGAGEAVQRIANLTAEQSNLQGLVQGYIQSQQPAHRPYASEESRAARRPEEMDQQDLADIMNTSRYSGKGFTAQDYDNLRRGLGGYKTLRGTESK
jgi:hypothetical protein